MTLLSNLSLSSRKNMTRRRHSGRCVPPTFLVAGGGLYTPRQGQHHPKDHTHPRTITPPRPHPTPSFMLPIVGFVRLRTYLLDKCQLKLEIQRERKADSTEKIYLHLITCFHRTIHKEWILNPLQACRVACTPGPS